MKQEHVLEWERILGLPVTDVEPFRRNCRVITAAGDWVVKPVRHPRQLHWWLSVDRELRMRGFHSMPPMLTDGRRWQITPLIDGLPASYRDRDQIRNAARLLAIFHRLGQGLMTPPFHGGSGLFLRRLNARLDSCGRLLQKAEGIGGEIGELLHVYGKAYYRYGLEARKRIAGYPLADLFHRERLARFVAHRDLASHNWLVDGVGNLWLIDFETADYDWQLGDLWQLLSRALPEQGWDRSVWSEAVAAYREVRPLSSLEMAILRDMLGFPNEFFREALGLIKGKRGYHPEAVIPYLKRIVGTTAAWRRFLRALR
jgi:hypothetical protein